MSATPAGGPPAWTAHLAGPAATAQLAAALAPTLAAGRALGLVGPLGAGKTTFVRALARALGVADAEPVASPSYAVVHTYAARSGVLVHADLYRVASLEAGLALGLDEAFARGDGAVVVEWADLWPDLLPADAAWLSLAPVPGQPEARLASGVGLPCPALPGASSGSSSGAARSAAAPAG